MKITMTYEWPLVKPFPGHVPMLVHVDRAQKPLNCVDCPRCAEGWMVYRIQTDNEVCVKCGHVLSTDDKVRMAKAMKS